VSEAAAPALRDIHLPPEPAWWPPAPGWWLLAVVVLLLAFVLGRWLLQRLRARRWRSQVEAELDAIAARHAGPGAGVALAAGISQLLRRASRVLDPRAVALRGDDWLAFLDHQLPETEAAAAPFRSGAGRVLADVPYRPAGASDAVDGPALVALARRWLRAALGKRDHA
jgi:hypothetical protein